MASSAVVGALRVLLSADTAAFDKAMSGADASTKKLANTMKRDLEPSQTRINQLVRQFAGTKEIGMAENWARAIKEAGGAANLTAQHQEKANAVVQRALTHYKALGQQAPAHLLELEKATRRIEAPTEKLGSNIDMVGSKFRSLAGMFGIGFGVAAVGGFVKGVFDAAEQVVDLSDKMGVSIEAAQRFKFAANQAGAEIDDVSRAIVKMNDNLAEGDKSTIKALTDAGLSFDKIRAMKPEEAFRAIADAIGKIPDPMKQTQITMELFGKSGAEILPMIKSNALQVADGMKVMSEQTAKRLEEAKQNWENFWASLTIISAETLSSIPKALDVFWEQFKKKMHPGPSGLGFLNTFVEGMADPQAFSRMLVAQAAIDEANRPKDINLPGPAVETAKAVKQLTDEQKKLNDELQRGADILTGKALAKRVQEWADKVRMAGGESKITAFQMRELREELEALVKQGAKLPPVLDAIRKAGLSPVFANLQQNALTMRELMKNAIPGADIMGQKPPDFVKFLPQELMGQWGRTWETMWTPKLAKATESGFTLGMREAFDDLPTIALRAFQGGGDVGKSIGARFAGSILSNLTGEMKEGQFTSGIGKALQGSLGKTIGGAIGSFIPGFGALVGGALGGMFGKLFGPGEGARVNDMRDQFMAANGGAKELLHTIASLGNDPELVRAWERINSAGSEKAFKSATDAYQKRLKEIQTALGQTAAKLDSLGATAQKFGGVLPKSLHAAAQQILGMTGLTGDLRKQLEKLIGQPSWEVLEERASALGIDKGALGAGFNQEKTKALALGFVRDITMFKEAGADVDGVLRGMADELSSLLIEARKTGAQLPKTLEPFLKRLSEMGLLLDENGNAIEMGAFSFADFEDEALIAMRDLLTEIKDILAKAFPAAANAAADAIRRLSGTLVGVGGARPQPVTVGGDGGFAPWMPPTLSGTASLTPSLATAFDGSAVAGGGTYNIYALDSQSFETYLRRGGADTIARTLPDATARYVGKR